MADTTGVVLTPGVEVLANIANYYRAVDAIHITCGSAADIVQMDLNLSIACARWPTQYQMFTIDDAGAHSAILSMEPIFTWTDPNPPANNIRGIITLPKNLIVLRPTNILTAAGVANADGIHIIGVGADAANSYDVTNNGPLNVVCHFRDLDMQGFDG